MNFARMFLDSICQRVVSTVMYVRDSIVSFVYSDTDSSIDIDQVHRPFSEDDEEDVFYDAVEGDDDDDTMVETKALKGGMVHYTIKAQGLTDPTSFMESVKPKVVNQLLKPETKVYIRLECVMKKNDPTNGTEETVRKTFRSSNHIVYPHYIDDTYDKMVAEVLEEFAKYQMDGSGWSLKSTDSLLVSVAGWKPMKGSSYIPLPKNLKNKKALINMKNSDQECFKWAVTRRLNPVDIHPERITKTLIEQSEQYDWSGISFPTPTDEIARFEKNNNISINVIADNGDGRIYPLQGSRDKFETKITLMLITDDDRNSHYVVVKDLSRLLCNQVTKKHAKRHYCFNCFNGFTSGIRLAEHMEYCNDKDCVKTILPTLDKSMLKFKNFKNTQRLQFIFFSDFECFTKPLEIDDTARTTRYQKHEPSGFCYYVKCSEEGVYGKEPVLFTKENEHDDVSKRFVKCLEGTLKEIVELYDNPKSMKFGESDREMHNLSTRCHVCQHDLTVNGELDKVKDHCHLTGRYRGAAHSKCNLAIRNPKFIPVVFHNLEGYDSHLFIKNLGVSEGWIRCIPKTDEKYISFTKSVVVGEYIDKDGEVRTRKGSLRFIDSIKFMSAGLGNLVSNLEEDRFRCISKFYGGERLSLLLRKGVYPYDYMSELTKLNDTCLPVIKGFYNRLNDEDISTEDYNHAQNVWDHFGCKTMRDYHDLYLKSDVLLLADVFETFRDLCMLNY